jgi:hypothetical protein
MPANWKIKIKTEAAYAITATNGLHCVFCHKTGHTKDICLKTKSEIAHPEKTIETTLFVYKLALIARAIEEGVMNKTTFNADTGASSHIFYSKKYLTDLVPHIASITAGNDDRLECTDKGTYRGYFKNSLGKQIPVYLADVIHVSCLSVHLFSMTKCISIRDRIQRST